MQKSKLLLALIVCANFNRMHASQQPLTLRKNIEKQALEAIQKYDAMIRQNDNKRSDLLWFFIPISSALSSLILPILDKNVAYKNSATASIIAGSISSTIIMFIHSRNRKDLDCHTIETFKSFCNQLGADDRIIETIEIGKTDNSSDCIAFAKQWIQENITPK